MDSHIKREEGPSVIENVPSYATGTNKELLAAAQATPFANDPRPSANHLEEVIRSLSVLRARKGRASRMKLGDLDVEGNW